MGEQTKIKVYPEYRQIDLGDGTMLWVAKTRRGHIAAGAFTKFSDGHTVPLSEDEVLHIVFEIMNGVK